MSTLANSSTTPISAVEPPSTFVETTEAPANVSLKIQPATQPQCPATILQGESGPRKTSPKEMRMPFEFLQGVTDWSPKGSGAYARVFELKNEKYSQGVAVKMFDVAQVAHAQREHDLLESLKHHRSIVGTFNHFGQDLRVCYFVMALGQHTVESWQMQLGGPAPEEIVGPIACALVDGLKFLRKRGIIHCDIKPPNIILVGPSLEPQFIDFGLARTIPSPEHVYSPQEFFGSPTWMPQEQARLLYYSNSTDLFSCALVFVYMLSGTHKGLYITPKMSEEAARDALAAYIAESRVSMPRKISADACHFLFNSILLFLHEDRVGFPKIGKHLWLAHHQIATGPILRSSGKRRAPPVSSSPVASRPSKTRGRQLIGR